MNEISGKILVTGADRFIGSHLVEALIREGCDVRALVFYNSFNSWGWLDTICEDYKKSWTWLQEILETPSVLEKFWRGVMW